MQDVHEYGSAWRGVLFRKTYPQLEDLIVRSKEIYLQAYPGCHFAEQAKTWHFPNGAFLRMRSLERDADADNYLGHAYTWIGWDELPTWATLTPYIKLSACLRSTQPVPVKRIRSTGNPGGIGHVWCKNRFVGTHNKFAWLPQRDDQTGFIKLFVPSKVTDNKILLSQDPGYISRLQLLAGVSQALVKAWLEGDWDVVAGAYFDVWNAGLIRPQGEIRVQPWWPCWLGMDWGFKHCSAIYWMCTDDEGKVGVFDELVESGQSPKDLAEHIGSHSQGYKVEDFWLSHDAFAQRTDAETIGEQIGQEMAAWGLPYPAKASTDRIGGAQLLYKLFKFKRIWISDKCAELLNVLPAIVHDPDKPEQTLKMDGDDPYDGLRYGVYGKLGPRARPENDLIMEKINHPDPTIRHMQALLAKKQLQQAGKLQGVSYNRRY
ncbi:MAG: hypothetical protein L0338_39605 [Acidobacteria bacterium]|nr:hypothetical protein [Acidobacteriota bacterium]